MRQRVDKRRAAFLVSEVTLIWFVLSATFAYFNDSLSLGSALVMSFIFAISFSVYLYLFGFPDK